MQRTKRVVITSCIILIPVLLVYFFKDFFLEQVGNCLIYEDDLKQADVMFVLGGNAYDRGKTAAEIFNQKYSDKIVCTGGSIPRDIRSVGLNFNESEISKMSLIKYGVPDSKIRTIKGGSSTYEESRILLKDCMKNDYKSCIILTSKHHTRRVKIVFKEYFANSNIETIIRSSDNSRINEEEWWRDEESMMAVNNEYMKILYYWWKY